MDFNTKCIKELAKAEKCARELAPTWKAHLYLKEMRIGPAKESQILMGAFGKYDLEVFKRAALTSFPGMASLRSFYEGTRGSKEGYQTGRPFHKCGDKAVQR